MKAFLMGSGGVRYDLTMEYSPGGSNRVGLRLTGTLDPVAYVWLTKGGRHLIQPIADNGTPVDLNGQEISAMDDPRNPGEPLAFVLHPGDRLGIGGRQFRYYETPERKAV